MSPAASRDRLISSARAELKRIEGRLGQIEQTREALSEQARRLIVEEHDLTELKATVQAMLAAYAPAALPPGPQAASSPHDSPGDRHSMRQVYEAQRERHAKIMEIARSVAGTAAFTRSTIARELGIADKMAGRDLARLVEEGDLVRRGTGAASHYELPAREQVQQPPPARPHRRTEVEGQRARDCIVDVVESAGEPLGLTQIIARCGTRSVDLTTPAAGAYLQRLVREGRIVAQGKTSGRRYLRAGRDTRPDTPPDTPAVETGGPPADTGDPPDAEPDTPADIGPAAPADPPVSLQRAYDDVDDVTVDGTPDDEDEDDEPDEAIADETDEPPAHQMSARTRRQLEHEARQDRQPRPPDRSPHRPEGVDLQNRILDLCRDRPRTVTDLARVLVIGKIEIGLAIGQAQRRLAAGQTGELLVRSPDNSYTVQVRDEATA